MAQGDAAVQGAPEEPRRSVAKQVRDARTGELTLLEVQLHDPQAQPRGLSGEDARAIVQEAQKRFQRGLQYEADARTNWMNDYKFANADAYNGYQWPAKIKQERDVDDRPCLTINKTRQHCLQIVNDAQQNKQGMKFRATGGGATFQSAQMYDALGRHIEYQSHATDCYGLATKHMVMGGWGYLRLETDYQDNISWDQEIFVREVRDPLSVVGDPDAKQVDKSDSNFTVVFEDIPRDEFVDRFPKYKQYASEAPLDGAEGWFTDERVRLAEYWRRVELRDTLYAVPRPDGGFTMLRESDLRAGDEELLDAIKATPGVASRETSTFRVERYLIVGGELIREECRIWPGKYIPLILVCAEETSIEGKLDRKSHTRALLDPQRMYNYWSSAAVMYGALQTSTPWILPLEAVEGLEDYWNAANTINSVYLPYNALGDDGRVIPPPQRVEPPVAAPVALEGMKIAAQEMMLVSGQYEGAMGQASNERTGKAINERQRAAENSTYHYVEGLGIAIRNVARQVLDLAPNVYDTKRVLQVNAEDGKPFELVIDPQMQKSWAIQQAANMQTAVQLFNPSVGKYQVEADIGPSYGTKRQETWNALTLILTQAPQLTPIIGDLLMKSGDFHLADEAATRLRRMVPAYALGEGPTQQEQALQAQVQQLTDLLAHAVEELSLSKIKLQGREQKRDVDVFQALSERIATLSRAYTDSAKVKVAAAKQGADGSGAVDLAESEVQVLSPEEIRALVQQAVDETLNTSLQPVIDENAAMRGAQGVQDVQGVQGVLDLVGGGVKPPVPGAKLGPNGHWSLKDPSLTRGMWPIT